MTAQHHIIGSEAFGHRLGPGYAALRVSPRQHSLLTWRALVFIASCGVLIATLTAISIL